MMENIRRRKISDERIIVTRNRGPIVRFAYISVAENFRIKRWVADPSRRMPTLSGVSAISSSQAWLIHPKMCRLFAPGFAVD